MAAASVTPKLFPFVMVCLWLSALFAVAHGSADLVSHCARAKAEYETMIMAPSEGSVTSSLFSSCLEADRAFEGTLYSIEVTGGKEFVRYVPDDSTEMNIAWTAVTDVDLNSITDCAKAAAAGGNSMFKYKDGNCQVTNLAYDLDRTPACDDSANEAVFVLQGEPLINRNQRELPDYN